jgi:hypothetical protein
MNKQYVFPKTMKHPNAPKVKKPIKKFIKKEVKKDVKQIQQARNVLIPKRMPKASFKTHSETSYLQSLLFPEVAKCARVSGMSDPTVPLHRKQIFNFTVNASGCAAIFVNFNWLQDNDTATSTNVQICNTAAYDGTNYEGSTYVYTLQTNTGGAFAIPAKTIASYRPVSGSAVLRCVASLTNQQGDIHAALIPVKNKNMTAVLGTGLDVINFSNVSGIINISGDRYKMAKAAHGQMARIIYCPSSNLYSDLTQPTIAGTAGCYFNDGNNYTDNNAMFIIQGAGNATRFELEVFGNYEVTPYPQSIIQGMDRISDETTPCQSQWYKFFKNYGNNIVQTYTGSLPTGNAIFQDQTIQEMYAALFRRQL